MERDAKPKLPAIVVVVLLAAGTTLVLAFGFLPITQLWTDFGTMTFLLTVPLLLLVGVARLRNRRVSASLVSAVLLSTLLFGILTQVATGVSPPNRYYLHDTATSGISPAGEYMNTTQGTGGFDTGTGADGSVTISASSNINTNILGSARSTNADGIVTAVTSFGSATGGTTLTVTSATGFAATDEVFLINLQGDGTNNGNSGTYEFLEILSIASNTFTLQTAIQNLYGATTSNLDLTGQSVIVQRVPQWTTVTINSGGTLTANAWDGSSGGVIVFRAAGAVNVNTGGAISADGLGYRGGTGGTTGGGTNGESYDGTVGSGGDDTTSGGGGGNPGASGGGGSSNYDGTSPNGTRGGGGGGGNTDGSTVNDGAAGGGGGGHAGGGGGGGGGADASSSGGSGGSGGSTDTGGGGGGTGGDDSGSGGPGYDGGNAGSAGGGGNGGAAGSGSYTGEGGGTYPGGGGFGGVGAGGGGGGGLYGDTALTDLFLGSGGGGGGGHDNGPVTGATGGDGGGIVFIRADSVTVAGSVTSNGTAGVAAGTARAGSSGGGAGGSIMIQSNSASLGTSLVAATGGSGGTAASPGGGGGSGGVGRVRIASDSISGTTNPTASTTGTPSTGGTTLTFDTAGQKAYWYADETWPTGSTNTILAAGAHTLNMYFNDLPEAWYDADWLYRKSITINSTKVSAELTDFPVLIDLSTDTELAANAQNDGDDILFTSSDAETKLNHEIERFNGTTGELVTWVNVTSLSSVSDTVLYMYYGNSTVGSQQNVAGTWGSGYKGVWHLNDDFLDSTSNNNDGTNQGSTDTTGKIGDSQNFAGSQWVQVPHSSSISITGTQITVSAWVNLSQSQPDDAGVVLKSTSSYEIHLGVESADTGNLRINATGAPTSYCRIDTSALTVGVWSYLTGTYDGATTRIYLNGSEEATCSSQSGNIVGNTEPVVIGRRALGDNRWFYGDIDEPRMIEATRSADWILTEYNNQVSPSTFYDVGSQTTGSDLQIVVSVHHTKSDGSDSQEIVTSTSVTIDGNTANPLALNIGSGAQHTFTTSDPRRLRLLINVTAVTSGGSFVLAYNSTTDPTNLETPIVGTGPQLVNPTLTPTSGSTTTNFNFTIDYRHPDGTPANVVRVNVSDAANGTYNNFTLSQIGNPEADYFVQESWAINGTVANFADAQSSSDGGLPAILSQSGGVPPPDPAGFVWLDVPDEVALGGTLNAWVEDQDLSDDGVPSDATGVILGWIADTGSDENSFARGSEDTNDYIGGGVGCEFEDNTWRMQIVKLGSNQYIDTARESTNQRLYVMAYTVGEDPLFLTVPTDLGSLTADSSWNTITVSGLDADTDGVLLLGQVTLDDDTSLLVRATGSTDSPTSREWEEYHCGWLPVKIDSNDQFQYRLTSGDTATLWLVAETKGSIDWLDTDRTDISPSSSGWVTRDLDSYETVPYDASGVILQIDEGTSSGCGGSDDCRVLVRKEGETWTFPEYDVGGDKLLHVGTGLDAANLFDVYQENASVSQVYTHAITRHMNRAVIQIDSVSEDTADGTLTATISHTTSGSYRLMIVGISLNNDNYETVSSVTYNGTGLTSHAAETNDDDAYAQLWHLVAPDEGTHDVVVTFSASLLRGAVIGVITFTGVDQTTPLGTVVGANFTTTNNPTIDVSSAADELVIDTVSMEDAGPLTVGPDQGDWWNLAELNDGPATEEFGGGSTEPGAPTVTMSWTSATSDHAAITAVSIKPASISTQSALLVEWNTTGIRSSGEDTLVIRYNLISSDDTFAVEVYNFTSASFVGRGALDQTAVSFFNYTLTADEKSAGTVRIRFNDTSDVGTTDLNVDYQLVNNTLWTTGITYYISTTLAAGEYSHFFWANDTNGVSNRTVTLSGPSVDAPPTISNFRLENATAASKVGEQIDVDVDHFFLFNVTDSSGWSDIGNGGNVSLRLWYDGDISATTQQDPTACEEVGSNWTSCTDGFSSNDLYAYANDSAGAPGAIAFDAVSSDNSTVSPLTFSHTIGGGSNRLLVVGIGVEGPSIGSTQVTAVTYNGVSLTQAINNTVGSGFGANAEVWYMLESDLPSAGTYTVSITVPSADAFQAGAISVSDAAQQAPEATASSDDGDAGDDWIETQITTVTDGAWIFDAVASGNGVSFTPNTGQTERYDVLGSSSAVAGGTASVATAGIQTINWTTDSGSNRITHSLAAWAPASTLGVSGANDSAWKDFGFSLGSDPISTVEVGVEWFRNNTAPSLNVTVSWDGGSSWATNQTATNKSADDDTVEWLDFTSATAWTPTKLNDANLRVRLGTNASGARLDYVTIRVVTTSELTYSQQTTGANYRVELQYVDTADPSTAALSEWSVTEGSATYNESASSQTPIVSGPTTIGYEFKLALKLGFQARQANDPVNSTAGSYNDVDSWNAKIEATDGAQSSTEQTASTGEHMEFGVYMYTNVSIGGDWSATGLRGQTVNSNTITVTYRSNSDFNLTIWFTTHLIMGGDTIDISNVQILAAADSNDNITSDTAFAGLGEANLVYVLGSASWYFPHATDANENTTVVQFSVFLPIAQAFGTYTAQLVIKIQQRPSG